MSEPESKGLVNPFSEAWEEGFCIHNIESGVKKLQSLIQEVEKNNRFSYIHEPRKGKPCLVLDLDHTLLHFSVKKGGKKAYKLIRPYMHEFLTRVYKHYDIGIWSQTNWRWVEVKLYELGMLNHPDYRLCFVLDDSHQIPLTMSYKCDEPERYRKHIEKHGQKKSKYTLTSDNILTRVHRVKPLQVIWNFNSNWTDSNTIHIDDLEKNFVFNPQCGFVCSKYDRKDRKTDKELIQIASYLEYIAVEHPNFSLINHKEWRKLMVERAMKQFRNLQIINKKDI